jgi:hypothetical protein
MTTSGTYSFDPSLGELTLYAFNIAGLRNTSLLQEHMQSARMATNMMLSTWANKGVNLWTVDLVSVPLVQGQATYSVDASTIMVLDAYMRIDDGVTDPIDRLILPISRTEYASYPNKEQQGFSTVFWFDRLVSPTITLWPVPDGTSAQYLKYYRTRQVQDSNLTNGQTVEIPYRWLEAFADGLAYRLSKIWSPEKAVALKAVADESYNVAAYQDVEQASQYISPQIVGYYRP